MPLTALTGIVLVPVTGPPPTPAPESLTRVGEASLIPGVAAAAKSPFRGAGGGTTVTAPAGSGKTTLLARFASGAGAPAAWYRCESWDSSEAHLLRHLEEAFAGVLGPSTRRWESIETPVPTAPNAITARTAAATPTTGMARPNVCPISLLPS